MATAVASECWKGINFLELLTETDSRGYEQYGAMRGEIILGLRTGSETHLELNMPGVKIRRWGKLPVKNMTATGYLIGVCGDGMVFLIGAFESKEGLKQLRKERTLEYRPTLINLFTEHNSEASSNQMVSGRQSTGRISIWMTWLMPILEVPLSFDFEVQQ